MQRTRKINLWILLHRRHPDFCLPRHLFENAKIEELFLHDDKEAIDEIDDNGETKGEFLAAQAYWKDIGSKEDDYLEQAAAQILSLMATDKAFANTDNEYSQFLSDEDIIEQTEASPSWENDTEQRIASNSRDLASEDISDPLDNILDSTDLTALKRRILSLSRIVYGIAHAKYGYDAEGGKKPTTIATEIAGDLQGSVSPDTIREYLRVSKIIVDEKRN